MRCALPPTLANLTYLSVGDLFLDLSKFVLQNKCPMQEVFQCIHKSFDVGRYWRPSSVRSRASIIYQGLQILFFFSAYLIYLQFCELFGKAMVLAGPKQYCCAIENCANPDRGQYGQVIIQSSIKFLN